MPITDWKEKYEFAPWMIKIEPNQLNNLSKISAADSFQVRSLSQERFIKKLGVLEEEAMVSIRLGLSKVLSI